MDCQQKQAFPASTNECGNDKLPAVDPVAVRERLHEQQLKCFASHCRTFYNSTTSVDRVFRGLEKHQFEEKLALASRVLRALDHISCSMANIPPEASITHDLQASDPDAFREIRQCGLDDKSRFLSNPMLLEQYITVRSQQRSLVHSEQMRMRLTTFYHLLHQAEESSYKLTEKILRKFVYNYCRNVGSHSFIAGFRTVLEHQIMKDNHTTRVYCLSWTFEVAAITESFYASQGDSYMKDVLTLLTGVFTRISKDGDTMISFGISPSWTNEELRRLVQCLPEIGLLNARPTGSTDMTNWKRSLAINLSREAKIDAWSMLHRASVNIFGCFETRELFRK